MKTKLASVLGLAVFVASFICGGSLVYAETEETSSVMQVIAPVDANGAEGDLSCVFDGAGADICTVTAKLEEVNEPLAVGGQETSSMMQIVAAVAEANGAESELSCILDSAGADICTVTAKLEEVDEPLAVTPATEAVEAIVVEVPQSVTVTAPGQEAGDGEEPAHTGSISEPAAAEPVVMLDSLKD